MLPQKEWQGSQSQDTINSIRKNLGKTVASDGHQNEQMWIAKKTSL